MAEATPASQFSDTNISFVADPLLSAGGCTGLRSCARVTMQSGQAFWSPTVDCTTGLSPALLSAPCASEYFCPVTSVVAADATPPAEMASAARPATAAAVPTTRRA